MSFRRGFLIKIIKSNENSARARGLRLTRRLHLRGARQGGELRDERIQAEGARGVGVAARGGHGDHGRRLELGCGEDLRAQFSSPVMCRILQQSAQSTFWRPRRVFSSRSSRWSSGNWSILLRITSMLSIRISPMTKHSAVCVWIPLETSMTSIMRSMICAPPMMVRINEAWPGQSTSVNCKVSNLEPQLA